MKVRYYEKRPGHWWLDFRDSQGERQRIPSGGATREEAERLAPQAIADHLTKAVPNASTPATVAAPVVLTPTCKTTLEEAFKTGMRMHDGWRDSKARDTLRHTFSCLRVGPKELVATLTRDRVRELVAQWLEEPGKRKGTKLAPSTINHRLSMLSVLLKVCDLPPHGVEHLSVKNNRRMRRAREEELQAVVSWCLQNHTRKGALALADLIPVGLATTARASELLALRWGDIYFDTGRVVYRNTKNGSSREGIIPANALRILERRRDNGLAGPFADLDDRQRVFLWSEARKALGLADDAEFVFHVATRHEGLTRLGDQGASAFIIKSYGGHESIAAADRYVKPELQALRAFGAGIEKPISTQQGDQQ